jgi:Skp family chaperone for outer membrane proteins
MALQSSVSDPLPSGVSNVQQRFAGFMSAIQESLKANQECVRADINSVKDDINSIKAEVRAEINYIEKDIKAENESLIKLTNQETKKELTAILYWEVRRLTNLVGQEQREFESELLSA